MLKTLLPHPSQGLPPEICAGLAMELTILPDPSFNWTCLDVFSFFIANGFLNISLNPEIVPLAKSQPFITF